MAKTPYTDLTTQDILSAHISGLSHSVNKIEEVLNMSTDTATITLTPVANQDDLSLRYRIYEGSIRNWTAFTVKRNGNIVPAAEYVAQPAFGVVVFNAQQNESDQISVDITYIDESSTRIETIESNISDLQTDVTDLNNNITDLEADISDFQSKLLVHGYGQQFPLNGQKTTWLNVMPGKTAADLVPATNILMAAGTIDAYPIFIETRTTISRMRVDLNSTSAAATMILGIYKDKDAQPGELVASTAAFARSIGENIVDLAAPITLDVGIYWVARYQSAGIRLDGHSWNNQVHINFAPVNGALMNGTGDIIGVRSSSLGTGLTTLPDPFPAVGAGASDSKYLARTDLGTVYALR